MPLDHAPGRIAHGIEARNVRLGIEPRAFDAGDD
jgi:hypothetical protein